MSRFELLEKIDPNSIIKNYDIEIQKRLNKIIELQENQKNISLSYNNFIIEKNLEVEKLRKEISGLENSKNNLENDIKQQKNDIEEKNKNINKKTDELNLKEKEILKLEKDTNNKLKLIEEQIKIKKSREEKLIASISILEEIGTRTNKTISILQNKFDKLSKNIDELENIKEQLSDENKRISEKNKSDMCIFKKYLQYCKDNGLFIREFQLLNSEKSVKINVENIQKIIKEKDDNLKERELNLDNNLENLKIKENDLKNEKDIFQRQKDKFNQDRNLFLEQIQKAKEQGLIIKL